MSKNTRFWEQIGVIANQGQPLPKETQMALVRVEFSIDDSVWPQLKLAGIRTTSTGERFAFDGRQSYDLAYVAFENVLHNALRPAVEELIKRRNPNPTT